MKNLILALTVIAIAATGFVVASCGETDPAYAPYNSVLTLTNLGPEAYTYGCDDSVGLPASCVEEFKEYSEEQSTQLCMDDQLDPDSRANEVTECLNGGGEFETCANQYCNQFWTVYYQDRLADIVTAFVNNIIPNDGCGVLNNLVSAMVVAPSLGNTVDNLNADVVSGSIPMNDVEVRFTAYQGYLYKLADDPSAVAPLAIPYLAATGDRGTVELKVLFDEPTACGESYDVVVVADTSHTASKITITVDSDAAETTGETDDDDTTGE